MSRIVAQFDPSAGSGSFNAGAVNRCSALWVMNESPNFLQFDFGGAATPKIIQPWSNKLLRLGTPVQTVDWSVVATLQSGSAPASVVFVEGYDPSEDIAALISGPLFRQSNVGNAAAVASATSSVQNDGNAAGTTVLEGTPSGASSSQALITNDGKATLGGGNLKIDATGKFIALPAGAVPVASIGGGGLPGGVTIPAGQVTGTLPAGQVGGGYPASSLSGSVPNATTAANLSGSIGANQVNAGNFPGGTFTMQKLALSGGGAVSGIAQVTGSGSATVNTGISGLQAVVVNTFNGSNSTTYGSGSYTTSTCYIYQFNPQPWVAICFNG